MASKKANRQSERRGMSRADARLSMLVEGAPAEPAASQILTESQNISASGVYCMSDHYLAPLSKVALTIVLPRLGGRSGQELIKCDGIVVRCQPPRENGERHFELACMFSGLDDVRRRQIDEFVTWRNLQALRAAARRAAPARKKVTRRTATAAARPARKAAPRRRTIH